MPKRVEHFTEKYLGGLEATGERYSLYDDVYKRLMLMVSPKGAKTFYVYRRVDGRPERIRLGSWPDVKVKQARERAEVVNGQIASGVNPADDRRASRNEISLGELWDRFLELHGKPHKKSWKIDKLQYEKHLSEWKGLKLHEITKQRVSRLHSAMAAKKQPAGGPVAANRVVALLSSMWNWGKDHLGLELPNPCEGLKKSPETPRDRTLSEPEMRAFVNALGNLKDEQVRDALWLMLLTGQRKSCVTGMRWSELNLRDEIWTIPGERMKSGRTHRVPLPKEAVSILHTRHRSKKRGEEAVFGLGTQEVRSGLTRVLKASELDDLTPHDLRRTCASWMGRHGKCDVAVVSLVLGHSDKALGILGTYRRPSLDEAREALERTVRAMLATSEEARVVPFPGAKEGA